MRLPANEADYVLIHNPRCSKSRAVQAMLQERGIAHTELRYLDEPLTKEELEELGSRLGAAPGEWVRSGEAAYRDSGLGPQSTPEALIEAMVEQPSIVQRPILVRGPRARVGRPPERILELLD